MREIIFDRRNIFFQSLLLIVILFFFINDFYISKKKSALREIVHNNNVKCYISQNLIGNFTTLENNIYKIEISENNSEYNKHLKKIEIEESKIKESIDILKNGGIFQETLKFPKNENLIINEHKLIAFIDDKEQIEYLNKTFINIDKNLKNFADFYGKNTDKTRKILFDLSLNISTAKEICNELFYEGQEKIKFSLLAINKTRQYFFLVKLSSLVLFIFFLIQVFYGYYIKIDIFLKEKQKIFDGYKHKHNNLEKIIENLPAALVIVDKSHKIVKINSEMKMLFGYKLKESLIGESCEKTFYAPDFICPVQNIQDNKYKKEIDLISKNGETLNILKSGNSIAIDGQKFYMEIMFDIRKYIRMEETLKNNYKRFQSIINAFPDIVFYKDKDGRFLGANTALQDLLKSSLNSFIGKSHNEFLPKNVRHSIEEQEKIAQQGKTPSKIEIDFKKGLNEYIYEVFQVPYFNDDNEIIGILGIGRDISYHKKIELELEGLVNSRTEELIRSNKILRENHDRFKTLIQNAPGVVFRYFNNEMRFISENIFKLTGYTPNELTGNHNYRFNDLIFRRDQLRVEQVRRNAFLTKEEYSCEYRLVHKYNSIIWVKEKGNPVFGINKEALYIDGVMLDITDNKTTEEEMKKSHENLIKINSQLKEMHIQMTQQEKLASIGQLAAGVAHEINNPTGFIMSNLRSFKDYFEDFKELINKYSLMKNKLNKEDIEEIEKYEKEIDLEFLMGDINDLINESLNGADRIRDIVQNLKNFARADKNDSIDEVNVKDILEGALKLVWNELKYTIIVHKDYEHLSQVKANFGQLAQVFTNIFVNAAQAIGDYKDSGNIWIKTYENKNDVFVEIADDGPGIPAEVQKKIFDPFFTTKEVGKGTGLGLNISYDIVVNKHKGQLLCKSEEGKGTIFTIILKKIGI